MADRECVLVVDDTPDNIHILMNTLKDEYKVLAATSGAKALHLASNVNPPDIILLDVMMPEMDGYAVIKELKNNESTKDIPVVFITAMTETEDEQKGLELGAVDYITKPFGPELVKARVRNQLELKRHRDSLEKMVEERTREILLTQAVMIESLGTLAEYRDPETGGHIKRTQNYVKALATHLKKKGLYPEILTDEYIDLLHMSAPLHDVGKVGVPDSILRKSAKLTEEEFVEMKRHTVYGYETLRKAETRLGKQPFIHIAKEIAYTHQEKWNGQGYPQGLKGKDIPLSGRLMALADVYDALISKRSYKPPFTHERALEIITKGDGRTVPDDFDPEILAAFVEIQETFRNIAITYADCDEERLALGGDLGRPNEIENVLLVEDHAINLEIMQAQLSALGFLVTTATNGQEALEKFIATQPQLVLTDLEMPVMDGYTLVRKLREKGSDTPVIAITANDYEMNEMKAKEIGFNDYMLKPVEDQVLLAKIRQICSKK